MTLMGDPATKIFGERYQHLIGAAGWLAFFFWSFVLGHFILLLGAALLDDLLYDPIRKATRAKQIERLAKGGGPSSAWQRFLARLIIKKDSDEAQPATSRAPTPSDQSFAVNFFRSSAAMASARS